MENVLENLLLTSRYISHANYDQSARTLTVMLWDGKQQVHHGVPPTQVLELCRAESPGQYYLSHIVPLYQRPWFRKFVSVVSVVTVGGTAALLYALR